MWRGSYKGHQHPSLFHWLALPTVRLVVVVVLVVVAAVEVGAMLPMVRIVAGGNNRF